MNFIYCYIIITNLLHPSLISNQLEERLEVCTSIINHTPKEESPAIALAIGWRESRYKDVFGMWICTRKGKLVKTPKKKYKCISNPKQNRPSKLTRAIGPMQILPIYHCKKKKSCSTTNKKVKKGVAHLYKLIKEYGKDKGIAVYAGGPDPKNKNKKAKQYAKKALKLESKIKKILLNKPPAFCFKDLLFWFWENYV